MKKKINIRGKVIPGEPLAPHTTFRVGGPADLFVIPGDAEDLAAVREFAAAEKLPLFILGGGANILVSDRGIRGIVVDMGAFRTLRLVPGDPEPGTERDAVLSVGAGLPVSDASEFAAETGFAGLENFYAMPGSTGGAVYMNARCYGRSVSDILVSTVVSEPDGTVTEQVCVPGSFDYKKSPFQGTSRIILEASFRLTLSSTADLRKAMNGYKADRDAKGHFAFPSAGSVFKNNREFGEPTGVLVDRLGLKGFSLGGAKVSDLHGNIIVNTGKANAAEIRTLIEEIELRVHAAYGFRLEREVIFAGDW